MKESLLRTIDAKPVKDIYVFGSWLTSDAPNDIDILITYDPQVCSVHEAVRDTEEIADTIEACLGLPVHLVRLTLKTRLPRQTSLPCKGASQSPPR